MLLRNSKTTGAALAVFVTLTAGVDAQTYRIERIASGLNQPTYVTQAPGDPANILYYSERTDDANPGFFTDNTMGRVFRYDVDTRTSTEVLDLDGYVREDTGIVSLAFHPDFNESESAGHGKLYVSFAEAEGSATDTARNYVEEFDVDLSGPNPSYSATYNRQLLQYDNNSQNNHTIDWIGFDPTAAGVERNYLYISTGDGAFGLPYNEGQPPDGRTAQNPSELAGKMLRVDVVGTDAYPADPNRNFAVPDTNPLPVYNAANPGDPIDGADEVWLTGLRNTYRASFDRQTGDLWMGDVGEASTEEVNFLKAGSNSDGPPVDLGWPQREGTDPSGISGTSGTTTNPFTGVDSLEPVQQFPRVPMAGGASIGGYIYRGPVEQLQGQYFYANFVGTPESNAQIFNLDFDRDTDPDDYDGANGTSAEITSMWQSLVFDPTDPSYQPDSSVEDSAGIDHVVSFGEDNSGNLYIVDFGNGSGFDGQYPGAGLGEIFRIAPVLQVTVTIDRDTGAMTFRNATGEVTDVLGYRLQSDEGAINPDQLTPIAGRLDNSTGGDGSVDDTNAWEITTASNEHHQFSETSTGTAASLAIDQQFALSDEDGWFKSIYEDVRLEVTLADGSTVPASVTYVGNDDQPFQRSDLNFNGELDPGDWTVFKAFHLEDLSDRSVAESYGFGDLDGDGDNDFDDFRLFQSDYTAELGAAAFQSLLNVPEPASAVLLLGAVLTAPWVLGRRRSGPRGRNSTTVARLGALAVMATGLFGLSTAAEAELVHQYTFNDGTASDLQGTAHGTLSGNAEVVLGAVDLPGDDEDFVDLPGEVIQINGFVDTTFEAWFTFRGGSTWQRVFDFGRTNFFGEGREYFFYSPNSGFGDHRAAITDDGGGDEDMVSGGPALSTGQSYHVAVVVDDSGSNQLALYLDGQQVGTETLTVEMNELANENAFLGNSNWIADGSLNGTIDEFRIYDHALSPSDVLTSFQAGPVPVDSLQLQINTVTGSTTLYNGLNSELQFDYYQVASDAGALDPSGWESLDDQNIDAMGDGEGQSWDEADQSSAHELAELFLLGGSTIDPEAAIPLGRMFDTSVHGQGEPGDLDFNFALQGDELTAGTVSYVTPDLLDGDFNNDGLVGAADYVLWRNSLGSTTDLAADADGDQVIDQDDYTIWRFNFGNVASPGAGSGSHSTPEPSAAILLAVSLLSLASGESRVRH